LAWRYFVAGSNILTDLLLMVQAIVLVSSIQTTARRRMMFAAIFLPRLLLVSQSQSCTIYPQTSPKERKKNSKLICLELHSVPIAAIVQLTAIKKGTQTDDPTVQLCENTIIEGVIQCLSIVTACWGQLKPFTSWMRSNGLKLNDADNTSAWSYKMSDRKTRTGKSDGAVDSDFSLPPRRDRILITHDWDVNSQSSQANIIIEAEDGGNNHHDDAQTSDGTHQVRSPAS
jgi:hypothetical protein